VNRIFGIILLLVCLSCPADAKIFARKQNSTINYEFDQTKLNEQMPEQFKSPDVPDVPMKKFLRGM